MNSIHRISLLNGYLGSFERPTAEAAEIFRSYLLAVPQDASVLKELRRIELANQSVD